MSQKVILKALPTGFLDDLPMEDQEAISKTIGESVTLNGYDDVGRAELEFTDMEGVIHTIYVDPRFLQKAGQ